MKQAVRYLIALLLSLFIHLLILQTHLDHDLFYSAEHSSIELGLVPFSQPHKIAVPLTEKTSPDKLSHPQSSYSPFAENAVSSVGSTISIEKNELLTGQTGVDVGGEEMPTEPKGERAATSEPLDRDSLSDGKVDLHDSEKYVGGDQVILTEKDNRDLENHNRESRPSNIVEKNQAEKVENLKPKALASKQADSSLTNSDNNVAALAMPEKTTTADVPVAIPRYEINPHPAYPDIALRKGWEGVVLLRVDVTENGLVKNVEIEKSSGFNALDRAALKAVRRWQFFPAMSAGVPIDGSAKVPINFEIP